VSRLGVFGTVLIVCGTVGSSTLQHNAMLVASHAIGIVERFGQVGSGVEIGLAAPRIPFVVEVRLGCSDDHGGASE
jgi:hypothetical protein